MEDLINLDDIVAKLVSVFPDYDDAIPLHAPTFEGNEWAYVKDCIDSGWVSSVGRYVDLFEEKLAAYTGVKRAVAVVNGTAALHMALMLAGVRQNDEVLVPTLTFVATANAVIYCSAVPHFVDSDLYTLGMDPQKLDLYLMEIAEIRRDECYNKITGRRISAVVPMHTFGHSVDIEAIMAVCAKYKLVLVEDAAESIGSFYKGLHTGNFGKVAAMSFNGNKTITTGGGGAILTNDEVLGRLAKHLTTQAKIPHRWEFNHDAIGYNYRMPNINAALGCAQLEQLPRYLRQKRQLAERYQAALQDVNGVRFFHEPKFSTSNYWLNAIILSKEDKRCRNALLELLHRNGIMARPAWTPMHKLQIFEQFPRMKCPAAERIFMTLINLPSSSMLARINCS